MPSVLPDYLSSLLGDAEIESALSADALVDAMLVVEASLAKAQAAAGDIPKESASAIVEAAAELKPDMKALKKAAERDGVPVPALVGELRAAVGEPHDRYVHLGATSQDVLDTAYSVRLAEALRLCEERLQRIIGTLAGLADAHRVTVMPARTRGQQATPTSFGLKAAGWMMPLVRWRDRVPTVRAEVLMISLGGASGTQAALGVNARRVEEAMAAELALTVPPMPWHTQRDGIVQAAGWLSGVAGSLGKIAEDVLFMCQSEVGELSLGEMGGSSTMPNKQNPTRAEAIRALADHAADLIGPIHRSAAHENERGGVAWFGEWLALPSLVVTAGAALRHAEALLGSVNVNAERMNANAEASNGLILAEAASFALSEHIPRAQALALVKEACQQSLRSGCHLVDELAGTTDAPVGWEALRDPVNHLVQANEMIDRALDAAGTNAKEETTK